MFARVSSELPSSAQSDELASSSSTETFCRFTPPPFDSLEERIKNFDEANMKLMTSGYADVNGIKIYHEIYGQGEPLVLIHGGLTTISEMQGWVQPLAKTRRVIAVEMQGHGRTPDMDRPMSFATMGDDVAALLDHLRIPKADLVGHSFGGASAIRAAIQHPDKVRRLVVISSPYARSGWYPEAHRGMSQVGAAMAENMMQTPTGKLSKQWPEPQRFPQFLERNLHWRMLSSRRRAPVGP